MEIYPGIELIDLGLYLTKHKILVLSDFHIGYEEGLSKKGVLVPRMQYKDVIARLDMIFSKVKPKMIVINGDLKHEFGVISQQEWKDVMRLIDYFERRGELVLIKGNHDTILGPIADKKKIKVVDELFVDDVLITHGHKVPKRLAEVIIIGHEHPAVFIRSDVRSEKYKCYLKGKYKRKVLIVQPSFNLLTDGTDVGSEDLLSPFLDQNLSNFEVFVVDKEIYDFGKLKNLSLQ
ncbi:metallophosphoesterase [Candidatus Woesearchaeota archaeon]|nr:metallophosphoesterase [Candidatus Woesearchaeota archaeon]MBW2994249.1 metallophosphoesterase [Candidatus Woesearchaeota archaeon]